ncbi:uncharacterized protein LOC131612071 [Vicia villosa]|uniref:uncharacterized protein LOC131612071 n=1 Tax=Vicia villosa TaxID=3911 RepID=UPI00273CE022|nr:uncharacterized protein LOC131612071 [Vicia villosa]
MNRSKKTMAAKGSPASQKEANTELSISDQHISSLTLSFLQRSGMSKLIPQSCSNISDFYSHFFANFIKVNLIQLGRISCTVSVKPQISNTYGTLHGGSVGSLVELLSIACARTVVSEDRKLFLGEINVSYLSSAPTNEEVLADVSVVKSGRNVTMVALEFKRKKTENLIYVAHATFYNFPIAKL